MGPAHQQQTEKGQLMVWGIDQQSAAAATIVLTMGLVVCRTASPW